jgi:hypothetical protein
LGELLMMVCTVDMTTSWLWFVFFYKLMYNVLNEYCADKDTIMSINIVKPESFFLAASQKSNHPNFKLISNKYIDESILNDDSIAAKRW